MKKSELIALLSDENIPDVEVMIAADEEGNRFHVLQDMEYYDENDDVGYVLEESGYHAAIVLWP